ncbi:glycosyltransferase family 2 protein [Pedobacter sp. P351]|uniref:glycosyltransferase family 2 protein n=1 Tax=Pedobacter superstes TaxID=3133441 RepID=UPI0030B521C6
MKVSICIPTFNQALFIEKSVKSAFEQTKLPYEIIVSDDCSTDQTRDILRKLSFEIPVLNVIYQPYNLGISKNTDACIRAATGDIIVRLDSDDYLSPRYVATLIDILSKYPDAGYVHAAVQEVDQNGGFLNKRKLFRKETYQGGDDALKAALKGYRVAANIIMFRKTALEKVNYMSGRPNFGEDYHLTASISAAGFGNVYVEEILSFYRVWVDSGKVRQRRKLDEISGIRRVFDEVIEPAFKARGWGLNVIESSKEAFACIHADCLSWSFYTAAEKKQLSHELKKLSSSQKALFFASVYASRFGPLFSSLITMNRNLKQYIKAAIPQRYINKL